MARLPVLVAAGAVAIALPVSAPAGSDPGRAAARPATTSSSVPTSAAPVVSAAPVLGAGLDTPPVPAPVQGLPVTLVRDLHRPPAVAASALAADGIPATALLAYQRAAAAVDAASPGCHLGWTLLAGIGRVESDHGRFAGATLYTDGRSVPKIIGIPLDGAGTERILDTDHGVLDGDP
ncbi:MAG: hypothetical protein ACTHMS_16660, partial [Jatrophihabitans sp.]